MKQSNNENRNNAGIIILIVVCLLIVIFGAIYFFTKDEQTKQRRDGYCNQADKLKKQILDKENLVGFLAEKIARLKELDDFLVQQAISLYRFAKLLAFILFTGACLMAYAWFNFSFWESMLTTVSIIGVIYSACNIYVNNKVGDFNEGLRLLQNIFIIHTYKRYNFDPKCVKVFELELVKEQEKLIALKKDFERYTENNRL